ncbi:MAG: heavy metal translocating P-type ATPase [bacterium]|nr:heavy metal translocating P-type ATPase [bacterium]
MSKNLTRIIIAAVLFSVALCINPNIQLINNVLYIAAYLIVGIDVLVKSVKNILKGKVFDENFLMTIATIGALIMGEFAESVAVMLFYQTGELFQDWAVDSSRNSIADLMQLRSEYANVIRNGEIVQTAPENIQIGEVIVVKPGEKVALDGCIIDGVSSVDTKALTGEPLPRDVTIDDPLLSGCVNLTGVLKIRVTKQYHESTVSKILDLVENASNRKSKSEKFITKFARIYTPAVVICAFALAFLPPLLLQNTSLTDWIYRALSFLVISCPCALVISIPLSFFGGIGAASKKGILIKGSNFIETIANIETVVFDKTGTLTQGVFEVEKIDAVGLSQDQLLKITAYAQYYSNHPISMSIKDAFNGHIDPNQITESKQLSGLGVITVINQTEVLVGNEKLMKENNIAFSPCRTVGTVIYVAIGKKYAGYILVSDKIKPDSAIAIQQLKNNNIKQTVMLTGDTSANAIKVAEAIKIDKVYAELLPAEKVNILNNLIGEKGRKGAIAFVGDGVNDAPALALADVGVAMGELSCDAALEAADVVIMTDEPSKITTAITICKKTITVVKQNIIFAIAVKLLILILSSIGLLSMWAAVFADVGVSIIAIINALRVSSVKNIR